MIDVYFGWQPSLPDFRDARYTPPRSVAIGAPPAGDLSPMFVESPLALALDQGREGSCGPHALAELLVYEQMKASGAAAMPSRQALYWNTRVLMGTTRYDSGVDNRTLMRAVAQMGWCDEELFPYNPGQTGNLFAPPPPGAVQQESKRMVPNYLAVPGDLASMRGCLAEGHPFILGFSVYASMLTDEVARTGLVPMPSGNDSLKGGHDVLCVGWDDADHVFKILNHWGGSWGKSGYGWMPYAYAASAQLASDFWTLRKPGWSPEPIPPPTPPAPVERWSLKLQGAGEKPVFTWDA